MCIYIKDTYFLENGLEDYVMSFFILDNIPYCEVYIVWN